jgi:hypothetical protein
VVALVNPVNAFVLMLVAFAIFAIYLNECVP